LFIQALRAFRRTLLEDWRVGGLVKGSIKV